jgi:hypothetical protein
MKPSDIKAGLAEAELELPYARSNRADPAITHAEALAAPPTNCRWHNGLIKTEPTQDDTDGKVFFCPIGKMYWRYTKSSEGFFKPLRYR